MERGTVSHFQTELAAGRTSSRSLVEKVLAAIADEAGEGSRTFLKVYADSARLEAEASDARRSAGMARSPIDGLPVSVKDVFDVAGDVTLGGSKVLMGSAPASANAVAVARLREAGAILVGRTNTSEFAKGTAGLNPHYGTPKNPYDRPKPERPGERHRHTLVGPGGRIPGGSSSGAAVSVADGLVNMGLGSDTRGSVRIPAALCGVVGFKPTKHRIPTEGMFPLSLTLDSVGPLANSVACCAIYDAILAGEDPATAAAPSAVALSNLNFLVPQCSLLHGLAPEVEASFQRALDALAAAGARLERREVPLLTQAQDLFKNGGVIAQEAYQVHQPLLNAHRADYDSRVAARIAEGESFSAGDYARFHEDQQWFIAEAREIMRPYDAMVYPTVSTAAPTIEEVDRSDEDYARWNQRLAHNAGLVNALDGCAVTIPCHRAGEAPVGFSVAGLGGSDKHVLAVAQSVEAAFAKARSTSALTDREEEKLDARRPQGRRAWASCSRRLRPRYSPPERLQLIQAVR